MIFSEEIMNMNNIGFTAAFLIVLTTAFVMWAVNGQSSLSRDSLQGGTYTLGSVE